MTTRTTGHSTEWTWRRAFLGVALAVASLPLAVGKQKHWERARVEAEILNPHEVQIRSENVTGLTLSLPAGLCPLDTTLRPEVQVNGQMLEAPRVQADGSWKVRLMEGGGRWSVVHSFEDGLLRKRHGLQGPIDDAFVDPFMMVAPTGQAWNESIGRWTTNEVAHPSNETAKRTP